MQCTPWTSPRSSWTSDATAHAGYAMMMMSVHQPDFAHGLRGKVKATQAGLYCVFGVESVSNSPGCPLTVTRHVISAYSSRSFPSTLKERTTSDSVRIKHVCSGQPLVGLPVAGAPGKPASPTFGGSGVRSSISKPASDNRRRRPPLRVTQTRLKGTERTALMKF